MQYLIIPLLIILAIGVVAARIDLPGFDFPNVLSILGWGTSTPSSQGEVYLSQRDTQPTNPLLDTAIIEGPQNNTVFLTTTTVTFIFSGTGPKNIPVNTLSFETKIEGLEESWQSSSGNSRTVTLPGGKKTYRFSVRSKLGNEVDPTPASRIFVVRVSPYFGKVSIGSIRAPSSFQSGTVTLQAYSLGQNESVSVTGWKLQGRNDDFVIPQGVKKYLLLGQNSRENIIMIPGTSVIISENQNPLAGGIAFQPNRCFGYFTANRTFPISVPSSCPDFNPPRSAISYLSPICQDFISQLSGCRKPDYRQHAVSADVECKDYLDNHFTYDICVRDYGTTSNFLVNQWHIYTEQERFLRPGHDQVSLYDSDGLFVQRYDY
ncbi:MAG: hypothetical protein HY458_00430 [Parcubacteria group bacterium]|nr:hypothetical protein [Parcubacteria group bacterium]